MTTTYLNCKRALMLRAVLATLVCIVILKPAIFRGQSTLGTILGRVTDQSGAVVPNAQVVLRNEGTNVSVAAHSNGDGEYVFSNLLPGTYEVTVRQQGFKAFVVNHIVVYVGQTVRENATLAVGTSASSVQVTANLPLVQTDTTSVGSVIDSKQIERMPLNGRTTIFGLLALAPGVQDTGSEARISGDSWIGANETMDGINNQEMENARLSAADPSLESLGEFKVIDSTGSAEYGGGEVQVILSTKSGTNAFHGSAFEYNRITALEAANFFATSLPKAAFIRNEFGGSLGGPIKRNKLFFFGSFEGLTFRTSSTEQTAQPTAALLNGNFSGLPPVKDPFTGLPFPDNQIPAAQINSVSRNLFPYFETPNLTTSAPGGLGTNYVVNIPSGQHDYRYEGRVDYSINPNNSLFARYYYVDQQNQAPGSTPKMGSDLQPFTSQSLAVNYTRTISPNLMNVATFGWEREVDQFLSQNHNLQPSSLIPGIPPTYPGLGGVPTVSITGFRGLSDGLGAGDTIPTLQFSDAITWVKGKHTLKGGVTYMHYQFESYGDLAPQYGAFSFTGQYTGNAFADFLLGYLAGSSEPLAPLAIQAANNRYGFFLQDNWKITPRLTLNMGLRYDLPTLYENTKGGMVNWYPNLNSLVVLKGQYDPTAYPTLPIVSGNSVGLTTGNYIGNDLRQLSPRFGLAYRPFRTSHLVVRGGYGIYYQSMPWKFGSYYLGANPPFNGVRSLEPAAGSTPSLFLNNAFPSGAGSVPSGIGITAQAKTYSYPMSHEWNLTLESQVSANTAFRATYLGLEREHSGAEYPINQPAPAPGPVQPKRPYQPFGSISLLENGQTSNTQELQLSAVRRFSSGLSFQAEYAWTKTLDGSLYDQTGPTDPLNIRLDRGNDPMIRQQYLIGNYVYELPFGAGKRYLSSLHGPLNALLGGWETSGIVTLASGLPYSVTFTSAVQGWPSSRADIIGNPEVAHPSLHQWFNPAAYTAPTPFLYGDSAPYSHFGPGFSNWDLALLKTFSLSERYKLQFRAEFFNALNHPSFGNPAANISVPSQVGRIFSTSSTARDIQFALRLEF